MYYEDGGEDTAGNNTKGRMGYIAMSELDQLSLGDSYYALIDSALSPVSGNVVPNMRALMGVDLSGSPKKHGRYSLAVRQSDPEGQVRADHYHNRTAELTGLSHDEVQRLNLAAFRELPFGLPGHNQVYFVSPAPIEMNDEPLHPVLRYYPSNRAWQSKFIKSHRLSGFFNAKAEVKIMTLEQGKWTPLSQSDVEQVTLLLEDQRRADSR